MEHFPVFETQKEAKVTWGIGGSFVKPRKVIRTLAGTGRIAMMRATTIILATIAEMISPSFIPRVRTPPFCAKRLDNDRAFRLKSN